MYIPQAIIPDNPLLHYFTQRIPSLKKSLGAAAAFNYNTQAFLLEEYPHPLPDLNTSLKYTTEVALPAGAIDAVKLLASALPAQNEGPLDSTIFNQFRGLPIYADIQAGYQAWAAACRHEEYLTHYGQGDLLLASIRSAFASIKPLPVNSIFRYPPFGVHSNHFCHQILLQCYDLATPTQSHAELRAFLLAWMTQFTQAMASALESMVFVTPQEMWALPLVYFPLTVPTQAYIESQSFDGHLLRTLASFYRGIHALEWAKAFIKFTPVVAIETTSTMETLESLWGLVTPLPRESLSGHIGYKLDLYHTRSLYQTFKFLVLAEPMLHKWRAAEAAAAPPSPAPANSVLLGPDSVTWYFPPFDRPSGNKVTTGLMDPKYKDQFKAFPPAIQALELKHSTTPLLPFFIRKNEFMEIELLFPTTQKTTNILLTLYNLPLNRHLSQYSGSIACLLDLAVPTHRKLLEQEIKGTDSIHAKFEFPLASEASGTYSIYMHHRSSALVPISKVLLTDVPEEKVWLPNNVFFSMTFFPKTPLSDSQALICYTRFLEDLPNIN
jgi:hypothetical protein